jgi:hypothetical protein
MIHCRRSRKDKAEISRDGDASGMPANQSMANELQADVFIFRRDFARQALL